MTIKIGNCVYSDRTEERLNNSNNSGKEEPLYVILMYERRARESMIADRLKIDPYFVGIHELNKGIYVSIMGEWSKIYAMKEFEAGREEFVDQVVLNYTFGVT